MGGPVEPEMESEVAVDDRAWSSGAQESTQLLRVLLHGSNDISWLSKWQSELLASSKPELRPSTNGQGRACQRMDEDG